ncbi:MAG: PAS domain S-box protein [Sedimenticola sp.]|nr:PAS domain S-box protein [Sedimenticola sp.]
MTETDQWISAVGGARPSGLGRVTEAVRALHGADSPEALLCCLVERAMDLLNAAGGGYAYDDGRELQAACRIGEEWMPPVQEMSRQQARQWAGQLEAPSVCNRPPCYSSAFSDHVPNLKLNNRISLPLRVGPGGMGRGLFELYNKPGEAGFDTDDRDLLLLLATSAQAALEQMRRSISHRQADSALEQCSDRLVRSQQFANIGTWDWDIGSGDLYWSERIGPLFGYPAGELETSFENFLSAVHPEDRQQVQGAIARCLEQGRPYRIEHRVVWPDGTVRWMLEQGDVQRDPRGKPLRMLGIVKDITERKEVEIELRAQRDFAEVLIDSAQMIVLVLDTEGRIVRFNPYLEEISGYSLEEVRGKGWFECFLPLAEADGFQRLFQKGISNVQTRGQVSPLFTKSGELREIDWYYKTLQDSDGQVVGLLATGQEITQRLVTENALRESEERFRGLVESTSDWIWEVDEMGVYTYVSPRVEQILGYPAQSLIGKTPFELMPEDEARRVKGEFLLTVSRHLPIDRMENVNRHAEGREVVLETSGVPFFDRYGRFSGYRGIDRDVTARKSAERALREQTLRNRLILENSHDGLLVLNLDTTLREVNDAYCRLVGYESRELLQMSIADLDVAASDRVISSRMERIMAYGHDRFEATHRHKDGSLVDLDISTTLATVEEDRFLIAFCHDITERRLREQERLQEVRAQRDTLVREIHHRIKNHLQGVTNLLRNHAQDHPQLGEALEAAIGQVSSIAQVHGLQSRLNGGRIELGTLLEVICVTIDSLTPASIELDPGPRITEAFVRPSDAVAVALVLNELLQNAVKHLPPGRQQHRVYVELAGDRERALLLIRNPGNVASLPPGFDLEKGVGLGTGLTLARDLLPHQGAELTLTCEHGEVLTRLALMPPVVSLE